MTRHVLQTLWALILMTASVSGQESTVPPERQLEQAIREGNVGVVTELIQDRSLLEQFYPGGYRPLHLAVQADKLKVVELLLNAGADRNRNNQKLITPVDLALELRRYPIVRLFYDKADPSDQGELLRFILDRLVRLDAVQQYGVYRGLIAEGDAVPTLEMDHFFLAAASGSGNVLEYLVDQGRSFFEVDVTSGWTVLHFLAAADTSAEIERFRENFSEVDVADGMGQTPLLVAAGARSRETMALLLDMGADPNRADQNGRTALHHAAAWGDVPMTKLLLEADADTTMTTVRGNTPLDVALANQEAAVASILPVGRPSAADEDGDFGVVLATCRSAIEGLKLGQLKRQLETSNPDLNATDGRGFALLHYAALQDSSEMIQVLVDAGADVNVQDATSRWSPLMIAAGGGQLNAAKVLLMNGANVNVQGFRGMTALHLAFMNSDTKMIAALRLAQPDETLTTRDGYRATDLDGLVNEQIAAQQADEGQ